MTMRLAMLGCIAAATFFRPDGALALEDAMHQDTKSAAPAPARPEIYAPFTLQADLATLTANERRMLGLFVDAASIMDDLFWRQAYGDKQALLRGLTDTRVRRFAEINYGPWDRLAGERPVRGRRRCEAARRAVLPARHDEGGIRARRPARARSGYTVLRRDAAGTLRVVPYHVEYADGVGQGCGAARAGRRTRRRRRAQDVPAGRARRRCARTTIAPSDLAWMDMKSNRIDVVIGPIETYEDQLFGYKAAYEAYVLVKDMEWSERLSRYAAHPAGAAARPAGAGRVQGRAAGHRLRPQRLRRASITPATATRAAKTIAINLPNDEQVQLEKGTRRLQLKNAMRAKFDKILVPIAGELIAPEQRQPRHVRRLLRERDVPRGRARPRHQEHASTARARCATR